jgi:hypothetical protein
VEHYIVIQFLCKEGVKGTEIPQGQAHIVADLASNDHQFEMVYIIQERLSRYREQGAQKRANSSIKWQDNCVS